MESHEADLLKKEEADNMASKEDEREIQFFREDTEHIFQKVQTYIHLIQEISKSYEYDFKEYIEQEVKGML